CPLFRLGTYAVLVTTHTRFCIPKWRANRYSAPLSNAWSRRQRTASAGSAFGPRTSIGCYRTRPTPPSTRLSPRFLDLLLKPCSATSRELATAPARAFQFFSPKH